jgi:serine/threonine protein kinase
VNAPAPPVAADDPRVIGALDEYVAALEAGRRPDRATFLAARADIAEPLAACLDGLDLVHHAAAHLDPPAADVDLADAIPLGDFRLLRVIGRGGMGVVYEAEQLSLGRRVALKVLPFAAALDPKQLQRFKNEAQAAAHLHHPHIVPVHAVGSERGVHYYAMQLIDGRSLAEVIRDLRDEAGLPDPAPPDSGRSRLPGATSAEPGAETRPGAALGTDHARPDREFFRRAARLGLQAALALEHAHQVGVVHRDVKPANLLVDTHDFLWVTDFGLAQFQGQAGLTLTGDVLGTLRYMSPEQATGGPVGIDHLTDVYSLGATLYELLTLRPAVTGTDRAGLVRQILAVEPVPPRRLSPGIPADLETVVLKALAKDPGDRYPTAQALADDLERFLADRPVAATRPGVWRRLRKWARRHRPAVATAAVAGVLLLVTAVVALSVTTARIAREERRKDEALGQAKANLEAADRQRQRAERNSQRAFAAVNEVTLAALEKVSRFPELGPTQRDLLEQALRSYRGFVQEGDPDPAARSETARAYALMAKVHAALDQPREAEAAGQKGIEAFERLTADFPADRAHRAGLADLHVWWGVHLGRNRGRVSAAADHLGRAVALYEQLAAEDRSAFRGPLATAYQLLAYHHTRASNGDKREAERLYGAALKLQEEPDRTGQVDHAGLAHTCNSLGLMHRLAGRPGAAEPLHRRALDHAGRAAPGGRADRGELARSHFHLAAALWALGRREEAVGHVAEAVALRQADAADHPLSPGPLIELVPTYRDQAAMLARLGRRAEAAQAYDRADRQADRLATRFPDAPGAEREWIATAVAVLEFSAAADRPAAERSFQRLREFEPTRAEALNDLAWYLATNPDPCFSDPARAVELAGKAVVASPEEGTYWNTLGVARYRSGNWAGAVAALEESRRLLGDQFESFNTFFLALSRWQMGDRGTARNTYDQAVTWMDRHKPNDAELVRFRQEAAALMSER